MTHSPAFQFYPDDFRGSGKVGTMTTEEVGAYVLLLCLDWNATGFAYDEEELARWCVLPRAKFRKAWVRVGRCFVERDGRLYNPRLEREREKQARYSRSMSENGRKGGRGKADAKPDESRGLTDRKPQESTPFPSPTPVTTTTKATTPRRNGASSGLGFSLAPYIDVHREIFPDSDPPGGRYGRVFKRLETKHGRDETLRRFRICLARKGTFATPEELSAHWSEYNAEDADRDIENPVADGWFTDAGDQLTSRRNHHHA